MKPGPSLAQQKPRCAPALPPRLRGSPPGRRPGSPHLSPLLQTPLPARHRPRPSSLCKGLVPPRPRLWGYPRIPGPLARVLGVRASQSGVLRPLLAPWTRTSGTLGPEAPGPPQYRARRPPPPSAGGRAPAARPAALGAARQFGRTQRQRPPTPPRRRDVRSLPGGGGGTHRAWGGARGGSSPPPPVRPPALAGRRAAPAPAPPPPPHPAPAPARPPLPLLTVSVGQAGGERPGRAGDRACAEAATAATATAAARPDFNTSGRRRQRAGALKGTRPSCRARGR